MTSTHALNVQHIVNSHYNPQLPSRLKYSPCGLPTGIEKNQIIDIVNRKVLFDGNQLPTKPGNDKANEMAEVRRQWSCPIIDRWWSADGKSLFVLAGSKLYKNQKVIAEDVNDVAVDPKGDHLAYVDYEGKIHVPSKNLVYSDPNGLEVGLPDWVSNEELGRRTGMWWTHGKLVFCKNDTSEVKRVTVCRPGIASSDTITFPYPKIGTPNAKVTLHILTKKGAKYLSGLKEFEYILSVTALLKNQHILVATLNRTQTTCKGHIVDLEKGKVVRTLTLEDDPKGFVDTPKPLIPSADGKNVFSLAFNIHGIRQLQTIPLNGEQASVRCEKTAISRILCTTKHTLFVECFPNGPLSKQIQRIHLEKWKFEQLTSSKFWNDAVVSPNGNEFIIRCSKVDKAPKIQRFQVLKRKTTTLFRSPLTPLSRNVFGTVKAADKKTYLHYRLTLPKEKKTGESYPLLLFVYGGPHLQTVKKAWNPNTFHHLVAERGWAVLQIDNRGTPNRDKTFEQAIKGRFLRIPFEDQKAALKQCLNNHPWIDPKRLHVYGHSFGGTMSTLLAGTGWFRKAVALAPFLPEEYDTGYSERFTTLKQAIENTICAEDLENLPKDCLYLMYGDADRNVLPIAGHKIRKLLMAKGARVEICHGQQHGINQDGYLKERYTNTMEFLGLNP